MYSYNNQHPVDTLHRIRLSNGMTRTVEFTEEELADAGWKIVPDKPECENHEKVEWNDTLGEWVKRNKYPYEIEADRIALWQPIRDKRNQLLRDSDITQLKDSHYNDMYAGILTNLWAIYRQKLRDITRNFASPSDVVWPNPPTYYDAASINQSQIALELEFYTKHGKTMKSSAEEGSTNV